MSAWLNGSERQPQELRAVPNHGNAVQFEYPLGRHWITSRGCIVILTCPVGWWARRGWWDRLLPLVELLDILLLFCGSQIVRFARFTFNRKGTSK